MLADANQNRRHPRTQIRVEDLSGRFQLKFDGRCMESVVVRDVSLAGSGIELHEPLQVDTEVNLNLIAGDWQLMVPAQVIWCRKNLDGDGNPAHPARYRIGIRFDPSNTHNNVLFYMAARTLLHPAEHAIEVNPPL